MSITCLSSKVTGLLSAWRNPYGREEEQLERFSLPLKTASPVKQLIRIGVAQAGFSLLILAASVETVVYAALTTLSFPLYLGNKRPHFCLELLKSSSFTIPWAILEIFRGGYMIVANNPLINAPTWEAFARMQFESLASCLSTREGDRAEIIKQILPLSNETFIGFCTKDDIWTHLRNNILNLKNVLSNLCQDLEDPNSLDLLKELHITNLCKVSSEERSLYFLTIKLIKKIDPNLLQLHLENIQKICTSHPGSLGNYFEFIKSIYRMISPMSLENRASLNWIEILQEVNRLPTDLDEYLINQKNEISASITFNQTQKEELRAIQSLLSLDSLVLWVSLR
ncbi:hypothetical protein [Candidatus Rhabdochlamydia sp. T3358]|uniref:hypothetical protein n=1 Tax=Candidatus Rhabdochlamydia sp. T3358 TaxID=2099795 RepID=UPI0010BABCD9|nr:hypothetical protein [Candidatus Rhabdochlamydia sp. T3358]VHO04409.1 hypothetical protein RHT_01372 [Candidatus Rhabdochlamydia sp. T3358]